MKKLVVALMVHIDDGWYGRNVRYYYAGPDGSGFTTKTEARKSASLLRKHVKEAVKINYGKKASVTGKASVGDINNTEEMPTYKYYGAGPSWACNNAEVFIPA